MELVSAAFKRGREVLRGCVTIDVYLFLDFPFEVLHPCGLPIYQNTSIPLDNIQEVVEFIDILKFVFLQN